MSDKEFSTPLTKKFRSLGLRRSSQKVATTPVSDVKVDYKSLEKSPATPAAPLTKRGVHLPGISKSTNCRAYRLSLSKRVRDQYKKKKLEFSAVDEQQMTDQELLSAVEGLESSRGRLTDDADHEEKVQQLKTTIAMWGSVFKSSLEELGDRVQTNMESAQLLEQLGISQDMNKYL